MKCVQNGGPNQQHYHSLGIFLHFYWISYVSISKEIIANKKGLMMTQSFQEISKRLN